MKLAFIVLVHKNPVQLKRLIGKLNHEDARVYLHMDRRTSDTVYQATQLELKNFKQIIWLPRNHTPWGSWGLVEASLKGLKRAREENSDYAILLSGQDYPIKPISQLVSFLQQHTGNSFIHYYKLPSDHWPPDGSRRYTRWFINLNLKSSNFRNIVTRTSNRFFNTFFPIRNLPDGLLPFGGWQWWCLERDCIDFVLTYTQQHRQAARFFKYVRIPDEMFFHTVILNSDLSPFVKNQILTYTDWKGPPFPRILTQADFEKLKTTEHFFARKFDMDVDLAILDQIDRDLL